MIFISVFEMLMFGRFHCHGDSNRNSGLQRILLISHDTFVIGCVHCSLLQALGNREECVLICIALLYINHSAYLQRMCLYMCVYMSDLFLTVTVC